MTGEGGTHWCYEVLPWYQVYKQSQTWQLCPRRPLPCPVRVLKLMGSVLPIYRASPKQAWPFARGSSPARRLSLIGVFLLSSSSLFPGGPAQVPAGPCVSSEPYLPWLREVCSTHPNIWDSGPLNPTHWLEHLPASISTVQ